jgi:hypothetical protein
VLFETSKDKRLDYEESILKRQGGLKYLYDLRESAMLDNIPWAKYGPKSTENN